MGRNNAYVDVVLRADTSPIDQSVKDIKKILANLGNNIDISGPVKEQMDKVEKEMRELQQKIGDLSKTKVNSAEYGNLKTDILNRVEALELRTTDLEHSMRSLIDTMASADSSKMSNALKELRNNMDKAAESTRGVISGITGIQNVASNANIAFVDSNMIEHSISSLERYRNTLKNLSDENYDFDEDKYDFETAEEAFKKLTKAADNYNKALKSLNDPKADNFIKLRAVSTAVESAIDIKGIEDSLGNLADNIPAKEIYAKFEQIVGGIGDHIADELPGEINQIIASLRKQISGIDEKSIGEEGTLKIPIVIGTTKEGLYKKAFDVVKAVQKLLDKQTLEVTMEFVSATKTKKAQEAIKKFQESAKDISDEATKKQIEKYIEQIQSGLGDQLVLNLKSSIEDSKKATEDLIKELRDELEKNPITINPKIEFLTEELEAAKKQVADIAKEMSDTLSDEVKKRFTDTEESVTTDDSSKKEDEKSEEKTKKKATEFEQLQKRLTKILKDIESVKESMTESLGKIPDSISEADGKLQPITEDFKALANTIETARESLSLLVSLLSNASPKSSLSDMIQGWMQGDDIMRSIYSERKPTTSERQAYIDSNGVIHGSYVYGEDGAVKSFDDFFKDLKVAIHSHNNDNVAFGSFTNKDAGDFTPFIEEYKRGIEKQLIVATKDLELWDVKKLYEDYQGKKLDKALRINGNKYEYIDFENSQFLKDFAKKSSDIIKGYKKGNPFLYIADYVDRFKPTGSNFSETIKGILTSHPSFAKAAGITDDNIENYIKQIRESLDIDGILPSDKIKSLFSDVQSVFKDSIAKAADDWLGQVIGRNSSLYQDQRLTNKAFAVLGIDSDKYIKRYSYDEFERENPLNLDDNSLRSLFTSSGIGDFASKASEVAISISKIVEDLRNIDVDKLKYDFDIKNFDSVANDIHELVLNLKDLTIAYKELNGIREPQIDTSKITAFLKEIQAITSPEDVAKKFKDTFGDGWEEIQNIWKATKPSATDLTDDDYKKWVDSIISKTKEAGIALEDFQTTERETVNQTKTMNLSFDGAEEIISDIKRISDAISSLLQIIRQSSDINLNDLSSALKQYHNLKTDDLEAQKKLQDLYPSLFKSEAGQQIDIIKYIPDDDNYEKWASNIVESVGKASGALDDFRVVSQKVANETQSIDFKFDADAEELKKVSDALQGLASGEQIKNLSNAFKGLSDFIKLVNTLSGSNNEDKIEATKKALSEIVEVLNKDISGSSIIKQLESTNLGSAIKDLGNALQGLGNIDKLMDAMSKEGGASKLEATKNAIKEIISVLDTDIGESSFMKSLGKLAEAGDKLTDIATIIKASVKQINNAQNAVSGSDLPQFDAAQDKLNKDVEEIQKAGRDYISQYGVVLRSTIQKNRDGVLEFIALVKTANDGLKEFTLSSVDGNRFNVVSETTNSPTAYKAALNYEKVRRAWEKMNETQEQAGKRVTNQITFDKDYDPDDAETFEGIMAAFKIYQDYLGNIQKITRQLRETAVGSGEFYESFTAFGENGSRVTIGREGEVIAMSQTEAAIDDVVAAYERLGRSAGNYYEIKQKAQAGTATAPELEWLKKIDQEYDQLNAKVQKYVNMLGEEKNAALQAKQQYETYIGKNYDDYLQKVEDSFYKKVESANQSRINQRNAFTPEFMKQLDDAADAWRRINEIRSQHSNGDEWDQSELGEVNRLLKNIGDTYKGIADQRNILARTDDVDKLISRASKMLNDNSLSPELANKARELVQRLNEVRASGENAADGCATINRVELGNFKAELLDIEATMERTGQSGKGFIKQFTGAITSQSANFLAQYFSLQDIIRYTRELADIVTQVDSANTELRKVTDESNSRIQESFRTSAKTAQEMGTTITEVINSTADWSRLGYSIDEAESLARVTSLFQTVGDNMTQQTASEDLVSMLQGFHIDASQAERVIDSVNEVANNFPIDTAGIGEALKRSAASFSAANTDINEAISLVTTANAVVQDPASVGTMFKTKFVFMYRDVHIAQI